MSSSWRRYEVMLPLRFNDGQEIPEAWLAEAFLEVVDRFGAASYETQRVEGRWQFAGTTYRDDLVRLVVDVPNNEENRLWIREFKGRLKIKLNQLEIWVVSYSIEIE